MSDLSQRLNLYIYTLQHYEDFPFLAYSALFPLNFFQMKKEKKEVCTAHDIVPILLKKININKIKVSKKDVQRFLKKSK